MIRRKLAVVLAVGGVTLTACGGPKAPFDVGTQAAPVDLVLGDRQAVDEAPVGPISAGLPSDLAPFFPTESQPPAPKDLGPCPDLDPLEPVEPHTTSVLPGPPKNGTYAYRAKTTSTVGQMKQSYAGDSTWKVTVTPNNPKIGGFFATIDVTLGTVKTQRVLLVMPNGVKNVPIGLTNDQTLLDLNVQVLDAYNGTAPAVGLPAIPVERNLPALGLYGPPGVYLVSQSMGDATFKPSSPIALFYSPIRTHQFTSFGVDGTTLMTFDTEVLGTDYINACGKKVETTKVAFSGKVAGLDKQGEIVQVDFSETINFGVQFGGLPVRDVGTVTASRRALGKTAATLVERTFDFTANTELNIVGQ